LRPGQILDMWCATGDKIYARAPDVVSGDDSHLVLVPNSEAAAT
jgi:hypothetical protein